MKMNPNAAIENARALLAAYDNDWSKVRDAGRRDPAGVIVVKTPKKG